MKLRELTLLLSIRNRFQSLWNGSETVIPVSRFKSVSPQLKPLIDRKIETYIKKFQSSEGPGVAPEVSPPDETALARQLFSIPSSEGVRTSQLGPEMTEPTRSEGRRGLKLPQLAFIYRQIAFIHQPISIFSHLRHREFSRRREAPRTPRER